MNQKTNGSIDLRIIIIGDEKVGKKTLAKRMQMLNSSETKQIEQNILLYHESTEEERKTKIKKLIYRRNSSKEEDPIETNFDYRDKETILKKEYELKKEKERKKIMSIKKIYKFLNYNTIKISIFPCIEMQPIINNNIYNLDDEKVKLDEFEKKYNKSIKGIINEINQIISIPNENISDKIEILFLFCFDLSNLKTFNNISLYYSQINKKFNINNNKNYNIALIGNKKDIKKIMKERQRNILLNFINKTKIKYYETSSLLYFDFENFFENLLYDIIDSGEFKQKFHQIISERPNFSKSQRSLNSKQIFISPSPNKYNNNPFEYPLSKKTMINLFKAKNKYNKKIFIDKKGPLYPKLIIDKLQEKNPFMKFKSIIHTSPKEEKNIKYLGDEQEQIIKKINNYLEPYSHRPGYSFSGILSDNSLHIRQKRRKINIDKLKEMNEAFDSGFNLTLNNKKLKRIKSYDRKNIIQLKKDLEKYKLKNQKVLEERHYNMKLKNESLQNEKINKIIEKEKKFEKKYLAKKKKMLKAKINYFKKTLKETLSFKHKINKDEPKAKFYDTASSFSLKKGFSFGHKPKNKKLEITSPEYPYLLDDFEKIVKKYQNKREIKSYSDRFPKYKSNEIGDSREKMEKKQKYFENQRKKLRNNAFSDFFDYIKTHKKAFSLKKQKMKQKEEEEYNHLVNNKYFLTEINYTQVETSYPKYSIRGKYNINNSLDKRENKNIFFDDEEDNTFENSKIVCNKFSFVEEEYPDIAKVRPNYPKYSFGKEKRFKKVFSDIGKNINKKFDFKNEDEKNKNWLFRNGNFGYNDKQSYLKTQTFMGVSKRMNNYKDNGVPGPGQYLLKGFADLITFKNYKKNKIAKTERNNSEK